MLLPGVQLGAERPTLTTLKEKALIGQYLLGLFLAYEGICSRTIVQLWKCPESQDPRQTATTIGRLHAASLLVHA
jgi:hypothetical protein